MSCGHPEKEFWGHALGKSKSKVKMKSKGEIDENRTHKKYLLVRNDVISGTRHRKVNKIKGLVRGCGV